MTGKHCSANCGNPASAQVHQVDAITRGECTGRRLVDAEPSFGATSGGPADETTLRVAPAEERRPGYGLGVEGPLRGIRDCNSSCPARMPAVARSIDSAVASQSLCRT